MKGTDRFRELPQVGERLEAAFHEAGYRTWEEFAAADPADLRVAANLVRRTSLEQAAAWRAAAAAREGDGGVALLEDGATEQYHSFIVKVLVDERGIALRSSAQDARTQLERSWRCWQPADLIAYIEAECKLASFSVLPHRTLVSIDAGTMLGGRRDVSLTVPADSLCSRGAVRYAARLMARPLGGAENVLVSVCRGQTIGDRDLALDFGEVEMPGGVQRLSLGMEVAPVAQVAQE